MKRGCVVVTSALWISAGALGCASHQAPFEPTSGAVAPGSAELSTGGGDSVKTEKVRCATTGYLTTIDIGDGPPAVAAVVSRAEQLTVEQVRIDGLNGFTGSYDHGIDGDAHVTMTGSTYHISGTADGIGADSPVPKTSSFTIRVSC